jgi:hypothetical protein
MLLGSQNITTGDTRRFMVSYEDFLIKGAVLTTVTVAVNAGVTSSIGTAGLAPKLFPTDKSIVFWVIAGVLNEVFTVSVQVVDNLGNIVNDTIKFTVVAP